MSSLGSNNYEIFMKFVYTSRSASSAITFFLVLSHVIPQ